MHFSWEVNGERYEHKPSSRAGPGSAGVLAGPALGDIVNSWNAPQARIYHGSAHPFLNKSLILSGVKGRASCVRSSLFDGLTLSRWPDRGERRRFFD
jgi:hypothetical protein